MNINTQYQATNTILQGISKSTNSANASSGNSVSFLDLLKNATSSSSNQTTTDNSVSTTQSKSPVQELALEHAIGRNYVTANRLAYSLQTNPERWGDINTNADLGLSEDEMMNYWQMSTSELTDVLMKIPAETFASISQATNGVSLQYDGAGAGNSPLDPVTFPQIDMENPLRILSNAPSGFNPSYGRKVAASEYLAGLARWGSAPHFDTTTILGGNGSLPDIPQGL